MTSHVKSLSDAVIGWVNNSMSFDLIGIFVEMLLESVLRKTAVGEDSDADDSEHVFDSNGHACIVLKQDSSGPVYGQNDEHTAQLFQQILETDISQEIRQISAIFTELRHKLSSPSHFQTWMQYFRPIQPFFSLLDQFCQRPPRDLSFLHNPIFVPSFHDLRLSFLEESPGQSEDEYVLSSLFPDPFELSSIKDPNSPPHLQKFLTDLCTFPGESSISMAFKDVSLNILADLNSILHPSPALPHPPRPFLLPLSEPRQSEDGTIFLRSLGNVMPLSKFTNFLVSRNIPISSLTVMKWYIESILGVEARFNFRLADSPLQVDDIIVDNLFRSHIHPLPSISASGNVHENNCSVSSEIQLTSKYFVTLIDILNQNHLIFVPTYSARDLLRSAAVDIQNWYSQKQITNFDHELLNDSLSLVLSQLLSEYLPLLENNDESRWDVFLHTLDQKATGQRKECDILFLMDDIFEPARYSILADVESHFHYLHGNHPFSSDPTIPLSNEDTDSEPTTEIFHSQAGSLATHSRSDPHWEGDESSIYALLSDVNGSKLTSKWSLGSNTTRSSRTLTTNPTSLQLQGARFTEPQFSSTGVLAVPEFPPEDKKSKINRHREEGREILDSLHQITTWAPNKHVISSKSSDFQDFTIDASRLQKLEMDALRYQRERTVKMTEWVENTPENLHRYPLLAWCDPAFSPTSPTSLVGHETMKTLSSFLASTCEAEEVIEWNVCHPFLVYVHLAWVRYVG
ncbi:hypothetical protein BLNAU_5527 [Blattamonas nauphoetae]|uniref:Uncharacterized protein n=1 Tax=Blattamonas nauphoetae TaxID=2049346 RepID=A0ABQ9Y6Y9_9EUKA|nr:hypothetical protein BLNAU_5527 [Blattamonas nauphoetae]